MALRGYYINLDERGEFYADVRNLAGRSIYEIHGFDIFEDGFMQHKNDTEGLTDYLQQLGVIAGADRVVPADEFERAPATLFGKAV